MDIFELGKVILKDKIGGETWEFKIESIFHLSEEEYAANEAFNDTLGNYEPDKELPTSSIVHILATSATGEQVRMTWCPNINILYPPISRVGWTRSLFTSLKGRLINWKLPHA